MALIPHITFSLPRLFLPASLPGAAFFDERAIPTCQDNCSETDNSKLQLIMISRSVGMPQNISVIFNWKK